LQSSEDLRARATDAMALIQHLQAFSVATDLADLPELFKDDSRQAEAAVHPPSPFVTNHHVGNLLRETILIFGLRRGCSSATAETGIDLC